MNEYQKALNDLPFDPDYKEKTIRMLKEHARSKVEKPARPVWQRYAPVAVTACVAVILLGSGVLWLGGDTTPPPVTPDGGVASVLPNTTTDTTTEPTPTTTQSSDIIEGIGGDIWYGTWDLSRHGTADMVINFLEMDGLITKEEYTEWDAQFCPDYKVYDPSSGKRPYDECSVYTFVRDFDVSREFLEAHNKKYEEIVGFPVYSKEALDLIYGDDEEAFLAYFASPTAVPVKNRIYSVRWLKNHTVEEWAEVGIAKEAIEEKLEIWYEYFGYPSEQDEVLKEKVTEFCG